MEEAAQILEIETFIPMLLQNPVLDAAAAASGVGEAKSALKRVVLIGDHNQLPPVVQNQALQKYTLGPLSISLSLFRCLCLLSPTPSVAMCSSDQNKR